MCGKDDKITVGDITISLMGHDTGRRYLVIAETDENFVLVCDGKYRKLDNPKQKRRKHLKIESHNACEYTETLTDSEIRKILIK